METKFVKGLFFKRKHENAPDFVLMRGSIKVQDMLNLCEEHINNGEDWINFDILQPKDASKEPYGKINDWKPENKESAVNQTQDISSEDIPF